MRAASASRLLPLVAVAAVALAGAQCATPAPGPAAQAKQLAARVVGARNTAARTEALLEVMRALRVPVYTAGGKQLVVGGTNLPRTFNLYDFQLRAAAAAFGARQLLTLEELAALFAAGGGRIGSRAVTPSLLFAAIVRGVRRETLLPRLVRELGLRRPRGQDLARTPAARVRFDPAQALLLVAAATAGSRGALRTPAALTDACKGKSEGKSLLERFAGLFTQDGTAALLTYLDSWSLTVKNTNLRLTHYGPPGHGHALAGRALRFGVELVQKEKVRPVVCGPGGDWELRISRQSLEWDDSALKRHGTTELSSDGRLLGFQPKNERYPGFGRVRKATGVLTTTFRVNPVGAATAVSKSVSQEWEVEYHAPRGYRFTSLFAFVNTAPDGTQTPVRFTVTGRVCGGDPFARPWTIDELGEAPGVSVPVKFDVTLAEGATSVVRGFLEAVHRFELLPGDRPRMRVQLDVASITQASGTWTPAVMEKVELVTEDSTCPEEP